MMKGALVELASAIGGSVPNVIFFQYNPESLRHTWSQPPPPIATQGQAGGNALAIPGFPGESFSFSLALDVTDQLADPDPTVRQIAAQFGIYPRIAALEMLLYPADTADQPTGGTGTSGTSGSSGSESRPTPAALLPTVLFVWGTGRILPVRVTSLTINETLYDAQLNPTHADASLELRVLTPDDLRSVKGQLGDFARAAYDYSKGLRVARAAANLGTAAHQLIGMLGQNHLVPGA
jgi:hypothetical protein